MTAVKKQKKNKEFTIEEVYRNKNFMRPKEKCYETIYEEPKHSKKGPLLTSTKKFKRFIQFDLTSGKIQKRKNKAKKRIKKVKGKMKAKIEDISAILQNISDSSDDCEMNTTVTKIKSADVITDFSGHVSNIVPLPNNNEPSSQNSKSTPKIRKCKS